MKKTIVLFLCASLFVAAPAYAAEQAAAETQAGIGFSAAGPDDKKPTPIENVLPSTTGKPRIYSSGKGTLPQTGESGSRLLRSLGVVCLMCCFWLFLVTRLKEEEEQDEKGI